MCCYNHYIHGFLWTVKSIPKYAHLDYSSKLTSADAMLNGLGLCTELKKKSQQPEKPTTGVISGKEP